MGAGCCKVDKLRLSRQPESFSNPSTQLHTPPDLETFGGQLPDLPNVVSSTDMSVNKAISSRFSNHPIRPRTVAEMSPRASSRGAVEFLES